MLFRSLGIHVCRDLGRLSGDIAAGDSDGALSTIADCRGVGVLDLPEAESKNEPLNGEPAWVVERLPAMALTSSFALVANAYLLPCKLHFVHACPLQPQSQPPDHLRPDRPIDSLLFGA